MLPSAPIQLPRALEPLEDLALDLRWSVTPEGDALWRRIDPLVWERTGSAWVVLQNLSGARVDELAQDGAFRAELWRLAAEREEDLAGAPWFRQAHPDAPLRCAAYFSMEFGLGEALPLYAGGLGILAGDALKAASDLGVPLVGIGLLYQEGYFRQMVDRTGWQAETYPYNEPLALPVVPVQDRDGSWLRVQVDLPGRTLSLRLWRVNVGRVSLYLLDANDPLNGPLDRGVTAKLYGGGPELRLVQEMVLGMGGWRALEALGLDVDVCHMNEGHAALATLERARRAMEVHQLSFREALWATRAGNVFTTHTPVAAGFDAFPPALVETYLHAPLARPLGLSLDELLALGRRDPADVHEPFNLAFLAARLSARTNGVSRLHAEVSRRIFAPLFPRWPLAEVPVTAVTNGVHVPSWESTPADRVWNRCCGTGRWAGAADRTACGVDALGDAELWAFRSEARRALVLHVRERLWRQLRQRGASAAQVTQALDLLDPAALTVGFARRFAEYKRPNLLLADPDRLARLLTDRARPVQLVVAGKAHPADDQGKELVRAWVDFAGRREVRERVVFLEDYDIALARRLVGGVDLWVNTPRRPWEACGTSGMKVLANGGLNLSTLDGWWAEAFTPEFGWAVDAGPGASDAADAEALYRALETEVVPAFYDRGQDGVPHAWIARMRASMTTLAPRFSASRMIREYVEEAYLPGALAFRRRTHAGARLAHELRAWEGAIEHFWGKLAFGDVRVAADGATWRFEADVRSDDLAPSAFRVELYADAEGGAEPVCRPMERGAPLPGGGATWWARVPAARPASDYTPRIVPLHPGVQVPAELPRILWAR